MAQDFQIEVQEAIAAGETALRSLKDVQKELDSAKNWGIVDLFGGGLITDLIKHSKMNNASEYMETAKADLHRFQRELRDVTVVTEIHVDVSEFLTFADYFFDGLIADYMVQSKINDARNQVETAISQVEAILKDLRRY